MIQTDVDTLLLVDDEKHILSSLKRLFRKEAYRIVTANSGPAALDILEQEKPHVIVSDYRMPQMTGVEFFQEVKKRQPDTVRVILSGYADAEAIVSAINQGEVYRFVSKPWNPDELKATVSQCFERYRLLKENEVLLDKVKQQNQELLMLNKRLEQSLSMSMRSLDIAQRILATLPIPVIGVSREGTVVLANHAAIDLGKGLRPEIGADMEDAVPENLLDFVDEAIHGKGSTVELEQDTKVRIEPMQFESESLGALLVFEKGKAGVK